MYDEHAMPMPLPRGSRPRFSRQPEASTTRSMHSPRPIVVTVR